MKDQLESSWSNRNMKSI